MELWETPNQTDFIRPIKLFPTSKEIPSFLLSISLSSLFVSHKRTLTSFEIQKCLSLSLPGFSLKFAYLLTWCYFIFLSGFSAPQSKPLQGFPFSHQQPDSSAFLPLSYHGYQPSPFSSATSSCLDASSAMKAGASLLESSALWDMAYGTRPLRLGADLSSGSSGYKSGASNTGKIHS